MAHPFAKHAEHGKSHTRVHHILKSGGHKSGGAAHADAAADRKLFRHMIAQHEKRVHGAKKPGRFARGGKAKDKGGNHTHIAVVVPQGKGPQAGAGVGGPPLPPAPPPGLPPGGPPPGIGGPPPGLGGPGGPPRPPMMRRGGKVKHKADGGGTDGSGGKVGDDKPMITKRGGRIKKAGGGGVDGDASASNLKQWSNSASKNSYARGGKTGSFMTAGALSGEGRLEKAHHEKRK